MKEIVLSLPPVVALVDLKDHTPSTSHHGLLQDEQRRVLRRPVYNNNRFCFSQLVDLYSDSMGTHESKSELETIKKALDSGGRVFAFKSFEDALRWALEK